MMNAAELQDYDALPTASVRIFWRAANSTFFLGPGCPLAVLYFLHGTIGLIFKIDALRFLKNRQSCAGGVETLIAHWVSCVVSRWVLARAYENPPRFLVVVAWAWLRCWGSLQDPDPVFF
eukprot:FR741519.1.p2 GENE.FR741519.1~~FR741519.1.p2  ORF type:complete len:120 (-),score=9.40 FR741519.1:14-373(-)